MVRTIWYHTVPDGTIWYHMVAHGIIWYHMVPYGTVRYHTVPHCTIWYHMVWDLGRVWGLGWVRDLIGPIMITWGTIWNYMVPYGSWEKNWGWGVIIWGLGGVGGERSDLDGGAGGGSHPLNLFFFT